MVDEVRVKYQTTWLGTIEQFLQDNPAMADEYHTSVNQLMSVLLEMEQCGVAPILPDGKIGGNGAVRLDTGSRPYIVVSKSGKDPNQLHSLKDFCIIESFDTDCWQCGYWSCDETVLPTSDTPMHYATLFSDRILGWQIYPMITLHGHGVASKEEADKVGLPCSDFETEVSTKDDYAAVLKLLSMYPYPKYDGFVRRNHGFLLMQPDTKSIAKELDRIKPHF